MFTEYYEDLYRDNPGSPYVEAEPEEEHRTCALCNQRALSYVQVVRHEVIEEPGEYFCEDHTQKVIDEYPGSYDPDEYLKITFNI